MPSLWRLALANKQIGIAFVFLVMTVTDETCIGKDIPKAYWFYAKVDYPTDCEIYDPVTCTACGRVHLVNPKSGKVLDSSAAS